MTEKTAENISAYLKSETEKNLKNKDLLWKVGGGLVVFVAIYMFWIVHSINLLILNPEGLADSIAGSFDMNIPTYIEQAEHYFAEQAPVLADSVSQQIMEMIPTIRVQGEEGIEVAYEMIPAFRGAMEDAINSHFEVHGDDIKAFYDGHNTVDSADYIVDGVVEAVIKEMDVRLKTAEDSEGRGLKEYNASIIKHLKNIDTQLKKLARTPAYRLSKSEKLQRKMIAAWMHALNDHFDEKRIKVSMLE